MLLSHFMFSVNENFNHFQHRDYDTETNTVSSFCTRYLKLYLIILRYQNIPQVGPYSFYTFESLKDNFFEGLWQLRKNVHLVQLPTPIDKDGITQNAAILNSDTNTEVSSAIVTQPADNDTKMKMVSTRR